jgi:hypothetical protein
MPANNQYQQSINGIAPHKRERVMLLRLDVHAHDIEASAVVAHRRAASATEQVE